MSRQQHPYSHYTQRQNEYRSQDNSRHTAASGHPSSHEAAVLKCLAQTAQDRQQLVQVTNQQNVNGGRNMGNQSSDHTTHGKSGPSREQRESTTE